MIERNRAKWMRILTKEQEPGEERHSTLVLVGDREFWYVSGRWGGLNALTQNDVVHMVTNCLQLQHVAGPVIVRKIGQTMPLTLNK